MDTELSGGGRPSARSFAFFGVSVAGKPWTLRWTIEPLTWDARRRELRKVWRRYRGRCIGCANKPVLCVRVIRVKVKRTAMEGKTTNTNGEIEEVRMGFNDSLRSYNEAVVLAVVFVVWQIELGNCGNVLPLLSDVMLCRISSLVDCKTGSHERSKNSGAN